MRTDRSSVRRMDHRRLASQSVQCGEQNFRLDRLRKKADKRQPVDQSERQASGLIAHKNHRPRAKPGPHQLAELKSGHVRQIHVQQQSSAGSASICCKAPAP